VGAVSDSPSNRLSLAARVPFVADALQIEDLVGLHEVDAQARLQQDGPNELPAQQKRNLLAIVLEVVREPMFLMLVAAGVVYLLLGEPTDALMLLGFVFVVMTITIVQARRTEHALEALRDLSSPRALVIRDGQRRRIAGREVVAGDLVVLAEGDRVPADGLLRQALHLATDESLLTGESVPVRKTPSADAATTCPPCSLGPWSPRGRAS
jgi:Ca2+-transporting ATPase